MPVVYEERSEAVNATVQAISFTVAGRLNAIPVKSSSYRLASPSFYLLRPDGHVGLAGATLDVDAVTRYLAATIAAASPCVT